jgi:hypothetical protein
MARPFEIPLCHTNGNSPRVSGQAAVSFCGSSAEDSVRIRRNSGAIRASRVQIGRHHETREEHASLRGLFNSTSRVGVLDEPNP